MTVEATAARVTSAALVVRPATGRQRTGTAPAEPARPQEAEPTDPPTTPRTTLCRCGHDAEAHEHYRPGSDCGACGAARCARFRAEGRRRWWPWRRRRA
jgi:hypothetical protein